jgi:hypothetical protein
MFISSVVYNSQECGFGRLMAHQARLKETASGQIHGSTHVL